MRRLLRVLGWSLFAIIGFTVIAALVLHARYGGGERFPNRAKEPILPSSAIEIVAELDKPPGNVAVSPDGRVFVTMHPEARPELSVVELVDGKPKPWPSEETEYQSVLSIRIDRENRLWALDTGHHGLGQPALLAFDLKTGEEEHRYEFSSEQAGLGSHLNDFQVGPEGDYVYIADASFFAKSPAIIVYMPGRRYARRVLEGHHSVLPDHYIPVVQGRPMEALGLVAIRPGVDSIALDRKGEWLYYAPVTEEHLYRIPTEALKNDELSPKALAKRVEEVAPKTMSDGIATDDQGRIYLTDLEHDAIHRLDPDGTLRTLVRDERLRWPDGLGFGPEGYLYVTCSALHRVIGKPSSSIEEHAPYQIFRFQPPGASATPGH